mmetsp:Transcript_135894/g.338917  ORF Transcript_135894/g.338917 Transcript_135894/m.338917 type:complete len:266 (+) Transcript_135894:239-1036(+)
MPPSSGRARLACNVDNGAATNANAEAGAGAARRRCSGGKAKPTLERFGSASAATDIMAPASSITRGFPSSASSRSVSTSATTSTLAPTAPSATSTDTSSALISVAALASNSASLAGAPASASSSCSTIKGGGCRGSGHGLRATAAHLLAAMAGSHAASASAVASLSLCTLQVAALSGDIGDFMQTCRPGAEDWLDGDTPASGDRAPTVGEEIGQSLTTLSPPGVAAGLGDCSSLTPATLSALPSKSRSVLRMPLPALPPLPLEAT